MSNKTKLVLSCLPFFVIGMIAIFLPKLLEWRTAEILAELEAMPLKSTISVSGRKITSTHHTFSIGSYGVTDVGNLRLAFADLPFSGSSSDSITLATDSTSSGGGGSTGVGNRKFEVKGIAHGSQCKFGGVTFEIVDGKLNFDEESIDVTGQPSLVFVGANRKFIKVKPIRTTED